MQEALAFEVSDISRVAEVRREAVAMAQGLGFDETDAGRVALVVTELATNLVKHTPHGGEVLISASDSDGMVGVTVLSLDQGPGLANVAEALRDGYSTGGSAGAGLGAVQRLSDSFDLYSLPGQGVALFSCLWSGSQRGEKRQAPFVVGGFCVAKPGQPVSGDAWSVTTGSAYLLVADGLGHGAEAATASREAVNIFQNQSQLPPERMLDEIHRALRHTRGAAVAVAQIVASRQELRFAGIGNIMGAVYSGERSRHLISHNGTAGHLIHKIQEFTYPWSAESLLIIHSDGLATRWNLDHYPGLRHRHPALIAGVLYRDYKRGSDDLTIVVVKARRAR